MREDLCWVSLGHRKLEADRVSAFRESVFQLSKRLSIYSEESEWNEPKAWYSVRARLRYCLRGRTQPLTTELWSWNQEPRVQVPARGGHWLHCLHFGTCSSPRLSPAWRPLLVYIAGREVGHGRRCSPRPWSPWRRAQLTAESRSRSTRSSLFCSQTPVPPSYSWADGFRTQI